MGNRFRARATTTYEVTASNGATIRVIHEPSEKTATICLVYANGEIIGEVDFEVRYNGTASAIGEMFEAVDNAQLNYEDGLD